MPRLPIRGTTLSDWLHLQNASEGVEVYADAGDDGILGSAFADLVFGGSGNDMLWGELGADTLLGEAGNDALYAGEGDDSLDGGAGDDTLSAGSGNDTIAMGTGDDIAWGDDGDDRVATGGGNDSVWAGTGNDFVDGGAGNDSLLGDTGHDTILGGEGRNTLVGGEGDDSIAAGAGNDDLTGDAGNDTINAGNGNNTIWGGQGDDSVTAGTGNDLIAVDAGNDTVASGGGNDAVHGNAGADRLDGGAGHDTLTGDDGADTLIGGAGNDIMHGSNGNDLIIAGTGADKAYGDGGNDTIIRTGVDAVADLLEGGAGIDTLGFDLTRAEWLDTNFQGELAGLLRHMGAGKQGNYVFEAQSLTVRTFEAAAITVDGVALTAADDAVTARADSYTVSEDAAFLSANVTANDLVADLVARVALTTGASAGALALGSDGGFTWNGGDAFQALRDGESRAVTFAYQVTDADGDSGSASVTITVLGANDGPTANADEAKVDEDSAVKIDVLANDSDAEGEELTLVSVSDSHYGAAIRIEGGIVIYDASASAKLQELGEGETAKDAFTYVVRDASGAETTQDVTVVVTGLADKEPPIVEGKTIASFEGEFDGDWKRTGDVSLTEGGTDGKMAALLSTADGAKEKEVEGWLHLEKGTLDNLDRGDAREGSGIRGKVDLAEGQTLGFDWLFATGEKIEGNDFAFVTIRRSGDETVTLLSDIKTLAGEGDTGWQSFRFTAEKEGGYEIGIGIMDVDGTAGDSTLMVDHVWIG